MQTVSSPPQDQLKTLQIIVGVLISALVVSMIIAVVRFPFFKGEVPDGNPVFLSYIALAVSLIAILVIRPLLLASMQRAQPPENQGDQTDSANRLFTVIFQRTLVEQAILEGVGHFNLAAYLSERQIWSLLVTTAIILLMVFRFPKRDRTQRWLERQMPD